MSSNPKMDCIQMHHYVDVFFESLKTPRELQDEVLQEMGLVDSEGLTPRGSLLFKSQNDIPSVMELLEGWRKSPSSSTLGVIYMILYVGHLIPCLLGVGSVAYVREEDCVATLTSLEWGGPRSWESAMYMAGLPCRPDESVLKENLLARRPLAGQLAAVSFTGEFWVKYAGCP